MKVVVAPNAFKGTLTAPEAAAAISRGVREALPSAEVAEVPVADGGDGTVEALVAAHGGERRAVTVEGPLGATVTATYGLIDQGGTAVVELASASGLSLIDEASRDPRRASTFGFGQLLSAALDSGARRVIAGIGGSATNDGGAGMAQALGCRLLDEGGSDLERGGAALARLARIDCGGLDPRWHSVRVSVACDVNNPLTGPHGASAVYGPQKGADPETVRELDSALDRFAAVAERDLGRAVAGLPGGGAAGGTGAGLVAVLGADLVAGAPLVVTAAGLDRHLAGAQLALTGEGRVDGQTAYGKAPGEVARRARAAGVPVVMLAGSKGPGWEAVLQLGVESIVTLDEVSAGQVGGVDTAAEALGRAAAVACRSRRWI